MTQLETDEALNHFIREIRQQLGHHLRELVLFGSRARGDSVAGSDYDCLAIVDEASPEVNNIIDDVAGELLFQYNALFSIIPVSEQLYTRKTLDPFLRNISKEGISL
jgi:uncharacterized protein